MDNEMIERCAIAIKEVQWGKRSTWQACDEDFKIIKRQQVVAVIKAIREPTEKMLEAGLNCHMDCSNEEVWKSMIDAIIADETYGSNSNPIIEANL